MSVTFADVTVKKEAIAVKFDVYPEDFIFFQSLTPNLTGFLPKNLVKKAIYAHKNFILEHFNIHTQKGEKLQGKIISIKEPSFTARGIDARDLMKQLITYRIEYPLATPPHFLSFFQNFNASGARIPAVTNLVLSQESFLPEGSVQLTNGGNIHSAEFNWQKKPTFNNDEIAVRKARLIEEEKRRLGLTDLGATYNFIYIHRDEIRVELLIPIPVFETFITLTRKDPYTLTVNEQTSAATKISEFILAHNEMKIDNSIIKPELTRLHFFALDDNDFANTPTPRQLSALTARIGMTLSYKTKAPPHEIQFTWNLFNASLLSSFCTIYTPSQKLTNTFSTYNPVWKWQAPKEESPRPIIPVKAVTQQRLSQIFAKKREALISPEEGRKTVTTLINNLYRAFEFHSDATIYDALSLSVSGELLEHVFMQIMAGLNNRDNNGPVSQIKSIAVVSVELPFQSPTTTASFKTTLVWKVTGTIEHFGHIHERTNKYEGTASITIMDGSWKITALNIQSDQLIDIKVSIRGDSLIGEKG